MDAVLTHDPFDPQEELAAFSAGLSSAGAVVTFIGRVRPGDAVASLYLEHHPRLTERSLSSIAEAAKARFDVAVRIVHRCGTIPAGEPIVFVAAAATHRRPAFDAVEYMMDRLKTDALFWKREDRAGGCEWIEPTEADVAARGRWSA